MQDHRAAAVAEVVEEAAAVADLAVAVVAAAGPTPVEEVAAEVPRRRSRKSIRAISRAGRSEIAERAVVTRK
jgi:hypothetical protein